MIAERESGHDSYALAALEVHIEGEIVPQHNAHKGPGFKKVDRFGMRLAEKRAY